VPAVDLGDVRITPENTLQGTTPLECAAAGAMSESPERFGREAVVDEGRGTGSLVGPGLKAGWREGGWTSLGSGGTLLRG
jgi:hypothetical protein